MFSRKNNFQTDEFTHFKEKFDNEVKPAIKDITFEQYMHNVAWYDGLLNRLKGDLAIQYDKKNGPRLVITAH